MGYFKLTFWAFEVFLNIIIKKYTSNNIVEIFDRRHFKIQTSKGISETWLIIKRASKYFLLKHQESWIWVGHFEKCGERNFFRRVYGVFEGVKK